MIPIPIRELVAKSGRLGPAGAAECIGGFPSVVGSGSRSSSLEVQGSQCQCSEKSRGSHEALCDLPLGVLEAILATSCWSQWEEEQGSAAVLHLPPQVSSGPVIASLP